MPHIKMRSINYPCYELWRAGYLSMSFRSWDLYEYLLLQSTTKFMRRQDCDSAGETAIIFALQTGRKHTMFRDVSVFDDCNLINVKLYLN